ncbi:allatostatin A [Odontomachus brunneus]|uniref:allatostatin A n=1 Tax=Odontomachus brunneus TaxID=486640 RepID=UPI0013F1C2E4|nr:allatostatin A [Odontomachus brunneus]
MRSDARFCRSIFSTSLFFWHLPVRQNRRIVPRIPQQQIRTDIMRTTPTNLTATRLIMLCLLSVIGESKAAIEEVPSSSLHIPRLSPLLNNVEYEEPSEKRSYAYVSEYKRLPLYNFGIGKRWIDNNEDKRTRPFSFGIGKRLRDYRFGIGKRNNHPSGLDYFPADNLEAYHSHEDNADDFMDEKRGNQPFSFGIGKRGWKLAEAAARRPNANVVAAPRYLLSLGKGMGEDEAQ